MDIKKTVNETINLQKELHRLMDDLTNLYAASRAVRCENTRARLTNIYAQKANEFLEKVSVLDRTTFIEKVLDNFFQKRIYKGMSEITYHFYYALAEMVDKAVEENETVTILATKIFLQVTVSKSDDGRELQIEATKIVQIE